jgi:hypothetical protein
MKGAKKLDNRLLYEKNVQIKGVKDKIWQLCCVYSCLVSTLTGKKSGTLISQQQIYSHNTY